MANSFIPINPKTGKAYRDGQPRKFKSWIGLRDNRTGEIKRIYERYFEDVKDLVKVIADEKLPVKKVDKAVKNLEWVPEVLFVNRRGYPIERLTEGMLGKWAVRDRHNGLWLFQLPPMTPPVPGRVRGLDHDGRPIRGESPGPTEIPEVQRYNAAAHAAMNKSLQAEQMITVFVDVKGRVTPVSRARYQVAYKLDAQGRDTELHEKLSFVKWERYELALLKSQRVNFIEVGKWSERIVLDDEKSVMGSLDRVAAKLSERQIREIRDVSDAFLEVEWKGRLWDADDHYDLSGKVDMRKDAEMLSKKLAASMNREIFSYGFRHTRLTKIDKEDGEYEREDQEWFAKYPRGLEHERSRDDRVNMLVKVSPNKRGYKFFKRSTGKIMPTDMMTQLHTLDQSTAGWVQFRFKISYFSKSTRTYKE